MKLTWLAMASVLGGSVIGVGLAGPAAATDDISLNAVGTYDLLFKNQTSATAFWAVEPCDDGADQCIEVSQFAATDTARKNPQWTKKAFWSVGSWIMEPLDGKRTCNDKTKYGVTYNYSWDATTNTGYRSFFEPGVCDDNTPRNVATPFALLKVGPPATAS